eukprot:GGOE01014253.1.p1 GENE.GGOE01014253.1~~GGOE01014253.1.p1  ORF type:complete len:667 (+),score=179.78 GGOE01014253.1:117-2003(+)
MKKLKRKGKPKQPPESSGDTSLGSATLQQERLRGRLHPGKKVMKTLEPAEFTAEDLRRFPKQFPIGPRQLSVDDVAAFLAANQLRIEGDTSTELLVQFDAQCLTDAMRIVLASQKIQTPTPIQAATIPLILSGRDCIGLAETGSGKTLSYVLPCVVHINAQPRTKAGDGPIALVLCPTRELVLQIRDQFELFGQQRPRFRTVVFYGGTELSEEQKTLDFSMQVCVGTPGRVIQYLRQANLSMRRVTFFVLDEADRMLDMGFGTQIWSIAGQLRADRQTVMWSATWPPGVQHLAQEYLSAPAKVVANNVDRLSANKAVAQHFYFPKFNKQKLVLPIGMSGAERKRQQQERRYMPESKLKYVRKLLSNLQWKNPAGGKAIVFVRTKVACQVLSDHLSAQGMECFAVHSNVPQRERQLRLRRFRKSPCGVLVATDVAARGLDVPDTHFVVNAEMPNSIEVYIHRIGRTARGRGLTGEAHSIVHPKDYVIAAPLARLLQEAGQEVPSEIQAWANGENIPSYDPRCNRMLQWVHRNEQRKEALRLELAHQPTAEEGTTVSFTPGAEYDVFQGNPDDATTEAATTSAQGAMQPEAPEDSTGAAEIQLPRALQKRKRLRTGDGGELAPRKKRNRL